MRDEDNEPLPLNDEEEERPRRKRRRHENGEAKSFPIGSYFWGIVIRLIAVALMVFFAIIILNPGACLHDAKK